MSSSIEKKIVALREKINNLNYSYYTQTKSSVSDPEFDRLLKELEELENKYPHLVTPDSPTQRVGSDLTEDSKLIKHKFPMLSIKNESDLNKFDIGIKKHFPENESVVYIVEPKIDGTSVSLEYKNGILESAATRGDGTFGEDITENVKTIKSIPKQIKINDIKNYNLADIVVRGEIFIYIKDFEQINKEREEKNEKVFENPRNTAAGILKTKDSKIVAQRPLNNFAYTLLSLKNQFNSQEENLMILKKLGFKVNEYYKKCLNIEEVITACNELENIRENLPYEIDGAVIKVNSVDKQKLLPIRAKYPRWAAAFKFDPEKATTKLEGITWQVGRTGIVTPVAELKPIKVAGSTISRASLHNFKFIKDKDIRIGDNVIIVKGGDVIPKVVKVIENTEANRGEKTKPPQKCPACKTKLIKEKGEVGYYCKNPRCPGKLKNLLYHFVSRNALDIEGIAETVIDNLIDNKFINSPVDLFKLDLNTLANLNLGTDNQKRLFGEKNAAKVIQSLEKAKTKPFAKWLFALGIPKLGEIGAQEIVEKHKTLNDIANSQILNDIILLQELYDKVTLINPKSRINPVMSEEEKKNRLVEFNELRDKINEVGLRLIKTDWYKQNIKESKSGKTELIPQYTLKKNKGVGPETAKSVISFLNSGEGIEILKKFKLLDLSPAGLKVKGNKLEGKIFVLTGSLPTMTRTEATEQIIKNGGKVTSKVSNTTDYVLVGSDPGSKFEEAKKLGIEIISEDQLKDMIS